MDIRQDWPSAVRPGTRVMPRTLTAKIVMRMINGARIRRMIMKIVADAWTSDATGIRPPGRWERSVSRPNSRYQNARSGLLIPPPH